MLNKTEIIRRATNLGVGIIDGGDNIGHPEVYKDTVELSNHLSTPIGDKVMYLTYSTTDGLNGIRIEAPIINVSRKKTVTSTQINGLDSSIFEVTSNGDYNISLSFSFITDKIWDRKREDFLNFLETANYLNSVDITNSFLNEHYNIDKVVIDSYNITPSSKYSNVIDIKMNLLYEADYKIFDKYLSNGSLTLKEKTF